MKEKIYTIPVTDAFNTECECSLCTLEKKLETESIEYVLGPSLMEPDGRAETNEKGFCRNHFEKVYNTGSNRLGLALILDTYLIAQNNKLKKLYGSGKDGLAKDSNSSAIKNFSNKLSSKQSDTGKLVDGILSELSNLESLCTICSRVSHTMERYMDVILYLWFKEPVFKELFNSKKGFCLKHFKQLLEGAKKHLGLKEMAIFTQNLITIQLENMERMQQEVNWFTQKFDYRNNDAPWGNSKDAVPRSIQKITGYSELK